MIDKAWKEGKKYILHHKEGNSWRIIACKSFGNLKYGEFGGLINSEKIFPMNAIVGFIVMQKFLVMHMFGFQQKFVENQTIIIKQVLIILQKISKLPNKENKI